MKLKTKFTLLVATCTLVLLGVNYIVSIYSANSVIFDFYRRSAAMLSSSRLNQSELDQFIANSDPGTSIESFARSLYNEYPSHIFLFVSDEKLAYDNLDSMDAVAQLRRVPSGYQFEIKRKGLLPGLIQIVEPRATVSRKNKTYLLFWFPKNMLSQQNQQDLLQEDLSYRFLISLVVLSVVAIFLSWIGASYFLRPLKSLTHSFNAIKRGELDTRLSIIRHDEVGEIIDGFNQLASWLQGLHQQYEQMSSDLSHELRTPLNALQSRLEAIEDGLLQPDKSQIKQLQEEVTVLSRMVEDLNLLSPTEANTLKLNVKNEDISALANNIFARYEQKAIDAKLTLVSDIKPGIYCSVDGNRLRQVLVNLLDNAFKYGADGHWIKLTLDQDGDTTHITVRDKGIGLNSEQKSRVFERFFQVQSARSSFNSLGLGLPISKQLIELMGGKISLISEPNQGCEFTITFSETS